MAEARADKLWAITCFFNPVGYRRRLANYRVFRQHLAVPLVTVELAFDGRFALGPGDAEILVQRQGGAVLWQKERLLNLALRLLPARCEMVAWLDCDIVFASADWAARACAALEAVPLVHLFHARHEAPRDWAPDPANAWVASPASQSVAYRMKRGEACPEDIYVPGNPQSRGSSAGLAWASRRDTLDAHGFYDAFIVGGGDRAMLCAALGESHRLAASVRMNAQRTAHYRAWAQACFERVRGRVGCIPGHVLHLWHGDLADRKQRERHHHLAQFDFDPVADLAVAPSGAWRWNSAKPALHAFVRRYFESRNEDGG
jgi:hypothetical protein